MQSRYKSRGNRQKSTFSIRVAVADISPVTCSCIDADSCTCLRFASTATAFPTPASARLKRRLVRSRGTTRVRGP